MNIGVAFLVLAMLLTPAVDGVAKSLSGEHTPMMIAFIRYLSAGLIAVLVAKGTGRAIVVAGATLMLGFGVMLFSSFIPVRHFGELLAVTLGTCTVGTIVVQPALLHVVGMRTRFKRKPGRRPALAEKHPASP